MNKTASILFFLFLLGFPALGQTFNAEFKGIYSNGITVEKNDSLIQVGASTTLELKENGNFSLKTIAQIPLPKYEKFSTEGKWISNGETVILNPDKTPRAREFSFVEKAIEDRDSITVKINYLLKNYNNEILAETVPYQFDMFSVAFNKRTKYVHLVRQKIRRNCGFAPRIKHQVIVDSSNTFKVARRDLDKIGIITYGFDEVKWFPVTNPKSNYFEITVIQPLDNDRTPRSQKVIIRKNKAHFYLKNDEITDAEPLKKQKDGIFYK